MSENENARTELDKVSEDDSAIESVDTNGAKTRHLKHYWEIESGMQ